jgi:alkanesulfonate monooxygenase SsuD/methylene tetrahydromethanopterin reductase-like flavin-dependent oxidoreductase (luciferase family)
MAACVDVLSNGRLEFGYGAGWKRMEYEAYGYPFPLARERIERLREAIQIIRLMWTQERASFHGRYYSIDRAPCQPKPVQRPHPPIWIGGVRNRLLEVAAEVADWVNFSDFQITYERSGWASSGRGPPTLDATPQPQGFPS